MNLEDINEMIKHQGVYEIVYRENLEDRTWHISDIEFSKEYGDKCITAYCQYR